MIKITDISGTEKYLNPDLIEKIELVPDTLVVLVNGHHYIVRDTPRTLIDRIIAFKREIGFLEASMPIVEERRGVYSTADDDRIDGDTENNKPPPCSAYENGV